MPDDVKEEEKPGDAAGAMMVGLLKGMVEGMVEKNNAYSDALTVIEYLAGDTSLPPSERLERILRLVQKVRTEMPRRSHEP